AVEDLYKRPLPSLPIIKEIHEEEEIPGTWGVRESDTTIGVNDGESNRKKKKRNRKEIEVVRAESLQTERDRKTRVHEMAARVGSSRVIDATDLSNSTAPSPDSPLSAPTTFDIIVDASVSGHYWDH
ncbi:hypothetical protein FXO38_12292, partial [Capsicum annuum]